MTRILFENEYIRQGILSEKEYCPAVISAGHGWGEGMKVGDILREIADATGWRQAEMAKRFHVGQGTISKWMSGQQWPNKKQWDMVEALIRRDSRLAHLRHETESGAVPVMGRVGAGSVIEPDVEQIPPEGLYNVKIPIPTPIGMVAFVIDGDSMYPRYEDGDTLVVYADQRFATTSYIGQTVVVKTRDGRRYLKKLYTGSKPDLWRLESFNAAPIHDVEVEWVGEIFSTFPQSGVLEAEPAKPRNSVTRRVAQR